MMLDDLNVVEPIVMAEQVPNTAPVRIPYHLFHYPPNPYFVEREGIIQDIKNALIYPSLEAPTRSTTAAFTIWGSPGQGKTQTALKFAYNHRLHFKAILWATADRKQKLLESFSEYAQLIGLIEKSTDVTTDASALMQWYKTTGTSP